MTLPKGSHWGAFGEGGSEDPLLSPDGTLIAFLGNGSLLLRPLAGGRSTAVVSGYREEVLLITGWSPDSQRLIYYLAPPNGDDPPPSKVTVSQYFAYDLKTKKSQEIKLDGSLCGWLPSGEMLIHQAEAKTLSKRAPKPGAVATVLRKNLPAIGQIEVSPDGRRIVASRDKPNDLITMDLVTGAVTPLLPPGGFGDFQWPKWNPSGRRIAWTAQVRMDKGNPISVLVVDGKKITKPAGLSSHAWLSDTTLVIQNSDAVVILDATTGQELGRHAFAENTK
jgi:Tol biopolymer transport system component